MLKYCLECWDKNKDTLEKEIRNSKDLNSCEYIDLVRMVVRLVFVEEDALSYEWDCERITEIDNGHYQGTLLYLIPTVRYQPSECDYLMTYVGYGSCSGCDTLKALQAENREAPLTNQQVKGFMSLCKDIVTNTIKPYNNGWRSDERFVEV